MSDDEATITDRVEVFQESALMAALTSTSALKGVDVEDGALIKNATLQHDDVQDGAVIKPARLQGMLNFNKVDVGPGMAAKVSIETSLDIEIERLIIAEVEGFLISSIMIGNEEAIGRAVPASLFRASNLILFSARLLTCQHMTVTVHNIDTVSKAFRAAVIYRYP